MLIAFFPGLERQRQIVEYEEFRGFDLSPAHPLPVDQDYSQNALSHRGDHSQSLKGEHSQSLRGEQSQSHRGGFETSHTEDTEMYLPVTQVVCLVWVKRCINDLVSLLKMIKGKVETAMSRIDTRNLKTTWSLYKNQIFWIEYHTK